MSRLKCGDPNCIACSDVGGHGICIIGGSVLCLLPEIVGNEPQYSVGRFAAFLSLFLPLEVFGDVDSKISLLICCRQLLIRHVIVALHVVVSDVHHRTFIYIRTHLPLVCLLNNFIGIFL